MHLNKLSKIIIFSAFIGLAAWLGFADLPSTFAFSCPVSSQPYDVKTFPEYYATLITDGPNKTADQSVTVNVNGEVGGTSCFCQSGNQYEAVNKLYNISYAQAKINNQTDWQNMTYDMSNGMLGGCDIYTKGSFKKFSASHTFNVSNYANGNYTITVRVKNTLASSQFTEQSLSFTVNHCPLNQTKPHNKCSGNSCVPVNSCGISSCTEDKDCAVPTGDIKINNSNNPAAVTVNTPYNVSWKSNFIGKWFFTI